jgi:hypothetical protein
MCLEYILGSSRKTLTKVRMSTVTEPSKVRVITMGTAPYRVILDLVAKICSEVLKKAFDSSFSGMS